MFTPDYLLDIAVQAEADYRAASTPQERGPLWTRRDWALLCAEWLETQPVKAMTAIGPFGEIAFKAGQRVRVKKGAMIHSLHPQRKAPYPAGATYTVTLHHVFAGYVHDQSNCFRRDIVVQQPKVEWAGAGGYWCWTDPDNVEAIG
jgi:hypothetical protein